MKFFENVFFFIRNYLFYSTRIFEHYFCFLFMEPSWAIWACFKIGKICKLIKFSSSSLDKRSRNQDICITYLLKPLHEALIWFTEFRSSHTFCSFSVAFQVNFGPTSSIILIFSVKFQDLFFESMLISPRSFGN